MTTYTVLSVEDDPLIQDLIRLALESKDIRVHSVGTGMEAVRWLSKLPEVHLVLLDLQLPDIMGYALAVYIRSIEAYRTVPMIAVSGAYSMEFLNTTFVAGFDAFLQKPFSVRQLRDLVVGFLHGAPPVHPPQIDATTELAYTRRLMQEMGRDLWRFVEELDRKSRRLSRQASELEQMILSTIHAMIRILEENERYTAGHGQRVGEYALRMGRLLGLSQEELRILHLGGMFHDLGKIAVDRCIIQSPYPLTEEQWQEMRRHPQVSYELLREIPFLADAAVIAGEHHERYDGKGYPHGKRGEEMGISSHIVILADAFDAMTSHRSYRRALPMRKVIQEIEENAGTQFHPEVAAAWLRELHARGEEILREVHARYPISE